MCGIAGCIGHEHAPEFVLGALESLEYRGYDSAGIGIEREETLDIEVVKALGSARNLRPQLDELDVANTDTAIGHTRWATHGRVTIQNTHPHTNESGSIAVVCNGTIENHRELRDELASDGYTFSSQTDTEVIPHLFDSYLRQDVEPDEAFTRTLNRLVGAYAVLAITTEAPEALYAARVSSPLVLGVNSHEHFAASDASVLIDQTKKAIFLDDYEMAKLTKDGFEITNTQNARMTTRKPEDIQDVYEKSTLGDFPHYMIKEIHDSAETVSSAIRGRIRPEENIVKLGGLENVKEQLRETERMVIVACGTSYYAGLIGEALIEEIAEMPVEVQTASEFKYRDEPFDKNTAVLAISQSGETADTIAALQKAEDYGLLTLGIVNSPASTIARMTDAGIYCHAGAEVSVASTKAFTSQVTVLTELALSLAKHGNKLRSPIMKELNALPDKINTMLEDTSAIEEAAKKYANYKNFLYIGRGYSYPNAMEGALKLKEVSYIHAEGYGAGEMKHGPLAMIDEDFPTLAIATNSPQLEKTISNIEEIRARNGLVLAIATDGNSSVEQVADDVIYVPESLEQTQPILTGIALQLFSYYVAVEKGLNVDRPRNLAKSVTVE